MSQADAIIATINGADAAIYAYGVIGAHSRGAGAVRARKALAAYRKVRESLQMIIGDPVSAASAYDLPFRVTNAESAAKLAVIVENRMAALLAECAAATTGDARTAAVTGAMEAAARAVTWGGAPLAFPHG